MTTNSSSRNARIAFWLNEAASLRRMVRGSRIYGGALKIRDEAGAIEKARRAVDFSRHLRVTA